MEWGLDAHTYILEIPSAIILGVSAHKRLDIAIGSGSISDFKYIFISQLCGPAAAVSPAMNVL